MLIEIQLSERSREAIERLAEYPQRLTAAIRSALDKENQLTVGHIVSAKLSRRGPKTLGVRSNRLRGSVRATRARANGAGQVVASIGTNVVYAGVHEFGFRGRVGVRAHTKNMTFKRSALASSYYHMVGGTKIKKSSKQTVQVAVRAHSRQVNFPKRAPIATGILERQERYRNAIEKAIVEAAEGRS